MPVLAVAWVLWLLLGWWMTVLAFQVVLSQRCNEAAWQTHPAEALPPPSRWAAVGVWLWACWEAPCVFFWRQPWQEHRWPDRLPAAASMAIHGGLAHDKATGESAPAASTAGQAHGQGVAMPDAPLRTVLFVHGFISNRGFWNPWLARLSARGESFVAVSIAKPFAPLDEQAAELSAQVDRIVCKTGQPPLIVGHSMGGLLIRAWLRLEAREGKRWQDRAHRVVCIGSPLAGTGLSRWTHLPLARQMARAEDGGTWLPQLNADLQALGIPQALFACWASSADNMVFPAQSALLPPPAQRHVLHRVPHVPLTFDAKLMQAVLALR